MSIQSSVISPDLEGQVIIVWNVVYYKDPDCVYPYFSWDRVLNSIDGSLRTFMDDESAETETIIKNCLSTIKNWRHRVFIPISLTTVNGLGITIDIYRWEIDHSTPLFRVLSKCYEQADQTLKIDILGLLSNPL